MIYGIGKTIDKEYYIDEVIRYMLENNIEISVQSLPQRDLLRVINKLLEENQKLQNEIAEFRLADSGASVDEVDKVINDYHTQVYGAPYTGCYHYNIR